MRALESLARDQERGTDSSAPMLQPSQQSRLRQDAKRNLTQGVRGRLGQNERSDRVVKQIEELLDDERTRIDAAVVERLQRQIQQVQTEAAGGQDERDQPPTSGAYIDPSRLPPSYRRSIERYFQKLSEQNQ
ncbi:MAG: hypothetical protein ACKPEY_21120 [Planctomycetota bacterium]